MYWSFLEAATFSILTDMLGESSAAVPAAGAPPACQWWWSLVCLVAQLATALSRSFSINLFRVYICIYVYSFELVSLHFARITTKTAANRCFLPTTKWLHYFLFGRLKITEQSKEKSEENTPLDHSEGFDKINIFVATFHTRTFFSYFRCDFLSRDSIFTFFTLSRAPWNLSLTRGGNENLHTVEIVRQTEGEARREQSRDTGRTSGDPPSIGNEEGTKNEEEEVVEVDVDDDDGDVEKVAATTAVSGNGKTEKSPRQGETRFFSFFFFDTSLPLRKTLVRFLLPALRRLVSFYRRMELCLEKSFYSIRSVRNRQRRNIQTFVLLFVYVHLFICLFIHVALYCWFSKLFVCFFCCFLYF